ncbi:MAG: hypothetical protein A3E25_17810 [Burkholderiales bacterium RIFCSPHIGHO2_12_FULL_69_20]|nr:MAG: hypothetical protein A3E25_17810 [Burkholderiales bacterium RIFCSPHIGHO2_12_FULL_69_20]
MSPPGRPKGEFRSAQHEGTPESAQATAAAQRLALLVCPLLLAACATPAPFTANWYLVGRDGDREDQKVLAAGVHVALLNRSQQTLVVRTVRVNPPADAAAGAPGWTIRTEGEDQALSLAPGQMLVGAPRWWPAELPLRLWPPCTLPVQVEITVQASEPSGLQRLLQGVGPANRWLLRIDPALPNAMPAAWADCTQPVLPKPPEGAPASAAKR